jgi:hypothetical protein
LRTRHSDQHAADISLASFPGSAPVRMVSIAIGRFGVMPEHIRPPEQNAHARPQAVRYMTRQ